jgi:hypothetical protein
MEWADYLKFGVVQIVVTFAAVYLASYLKAKGKNLATSEDIDKITDKIESVKTEYAKELESLKSQLNAKFHARTVRYEKEFESYKEIWDSIVELMDHIFELHIAVSIPDRGSDLAKADRKKFLEAIGKFYFAFEKNRPFFSPEVYSVIAELRHLPAIEKSITYSYLPVPTPEETATTKSLLEELLIGPADQLMKKTNAIEKAMRSRIEEFY